jgi:hypothetical protein
VGWVKLNVGTMMAGVADALLAGVCAAPPQPATTNAILKMMIVVMRCLLPNMSHFL